MRIVAVLAVLGLLAASCAHRTAEDDSVLRVGVVLPLTGSMAAYGANALDGIQLAATQANAAAANDQNGLRVKLFVEDSKGEPQAAVSALQKLISADKVTCVIGDVGSSATLAMVPIADRNKVLLFSPAASSPSLSNAGKYFFRDWPSDAFEANTMVEYLKSKKYPTVAIVLLNNDYGLAMMENIKKGLSGSGVEIVATEYFQQGATDLRAQITKVTSVNPSVTYLISYPKETITFLRQYTELGGKAPIVATSAFEDASILENQAAAAEGAVFTSPLPPDSSAQAVVSFRTDYLKSYGKEPGLVADYAYDALNLILAASKRESGVTGDQIKTGLQKIKDYQGASGLINFEVTGDVVKPAGLKTVKDGKYVQLQ